MALTQSGIILQDDETLVMELEAELRPTSSNPIAVLCGKIQKFLYKIIGNKCKGFLVITNKRVVEVKNYITCYCFNSSRQVKYVLPSSIKEVGYTKEATLGCCCPAYYLYYESFTQRTPIMLSGANDEQAQKAVDAFYKAIAAAQN